MRIFILALAFLLSLPLSSQAQAKQSLHLSFSGQVSPSNQAGIPFERQPIILLKNDKNETVSDVSCSVSLRLDGENASDSLLGTHEQRFSQGEANFNGSELLVNTSEGGDTYRLLATGKGSCADAKIAFSANFTVLPPETS